jgi:hypothetical protein
LGTALVFNIRVGGIPVYGLEDRQKVDLHGYWSELGGEVNLGCGTGLFCISVEGSHSVMVWPCASRTSHLDMGVM